METNDQHVCRKNSGLSNHCTMSLIFVTRVLSPQTNSLRVECCDTGSHSKVLARWSSLTVLFRQPCHVRNYTWNTPHLGFAISPQLHTGNGLKNILLSTNRPRESILCWLIEKKQSPKFLTYVTQCWGHKIPRSPKVPSTPIGQCGIDLGSLSLSNGIFFSQFWFVIQKIHIVGPR